MKSGPSQDTLPVSSRLAIAALAALIFVAAFVLLLGFGALGRAGLVDTAKLQGFVALPLLLSVPAVISYAIGRGDDAADRVLIGFVGVVGFATGLLWAVSPSGQDPVTCAADATGLVAIALVALSGIAVGTSAVVGTIVAQRIGRSRDSAALGLLSRYVVGGSILFVGLVLALGVQAVMHPAASCQPI